MAILVIAGSAAAGCAPSAPPGAQNANVLIATEPAYAPDDPCKGVVPQLCPR